MTEKNIVVLQENGVIQYVQTTVEAVEGLSDFASIQDTGWQNLDAVNGYRWHSLYQGQYRVINKVIYLRGCIQNEQLTPNEVFARIPVQYAPDKLTAFSCSLMSSEAKDFGRVDIGVKGDIRLISATDKKNVYLNQVIYPLS